MYCKECGEETWHTPFFGRLRCRECGTLRSPSHEVQFTSDDEVEAWCPRCENEETHDYRNGKIRCQSCGLVRYLTFSSGPERQKRKKGLFDIF